MDEIKVISVLAAAEKINTTQEEVKRLMKSGALEVVDREGGLPGVSERSVLDFIGEARGDVPKRRGRKPRLLTIEEAAFYLDKEEGEVAALVEKGELSFYEADLLRESEVKMYKKKIDDREERVAPKTETPDSDAVQEEPSEPALSEADSTDEAKDDPDEACSDQDTEEGKKAAQRKTNTEGKNVDSFDLDAVMQELFPGIQRIDKARREEMVKMHEEKAYTRMDMKDAVQIAYMRGKLAVYDSLESFERRV